MTSPLRWTTAPRSSTRSRRGNAWPIASPPRARAARTRRPPSFRARDDERSRSPRVVLALPRARRGDQTVGLGGHEEGLLRRPAIATARDRAETATGGRAGDGVSARKTRAAGGKEIPDFMRVEVEGTEAAARMKRELVEKLKPDKQTVDEVMGDKDLLAGFDDPEVMRAVDDVAKIPETSPSTPTTRKSWPSTRRWRAWWGTGWRRWAITRRAAGDHFCSIVASRRAVRSVGSVRRLKSAVHLCASPRPRARLPRLLVHPQLGLVVRDDGEAVPPLAAERDPREHAVLPRVRERARRILPRLPRAALARHPPHRQRAVLRARPRTRPSSGARPSRRGTASAPASRRTRAGR